MMFQPMYLSMHFKVCKTNLNSFSDSLGKTRVVYKSIPTLKSNLKKGQNSSHPIISEH